MKARFFHITLYFPLLPTDQPGKSETYLEAIRKNIEWLKKHNKEESKDGEMWELLWEMGGKRSELNVFISRALRGSSPHLTVAGHGHV